MKKLCLMVASCLTLSTGYCLMPNDPSGTGSQIPATNTGFLSDSKSKAPDKSSTSAEPDHALQNPEAHTQLSVPPSTTQHRVPQKKKILVIYPSSHSKPSEKCWKFYGQRIKLFTEVDEFVDMLIKAPRILPRPQNTSEPALTSEDVKKLLCRLLIDTFQHDKYSSLVIKDCIKNLKDHSNDSLLFQNIVSLDSVLSMSNEQVDRMGKTLSAYDNFYDNTSLKKKKDDAEPYSNNVVMFWNFLYKPGTPGVQADPLRDKQPKPNMVTTTLLKLEEPELKTYKGKIMITCAHLYSNHQSLPPEKILFTADGSGYLKMPNGDMLKVEASKARTSRFVAESPYKDIYVETIYFVPNVDIAFCVLNKPLPGADQGIKLSPLPTHLEGKSIYEGKEGITVGYGSGMASAPTFADWAQPKYSAGSNVISNREDIEKIDELHKASGWEYAKYRSGTIKGQTIKVITAHGDSGSSVMLNDGASDNDCKIIGIIGCGNSGSGGFSLITEKMWNDFKNLLHPSDKAAV